MADEPNQAWNLESFLDSVILDLDRAVDALSVKKDNMRMTYTVQDLSLALQVFPVFDGEVVRFVTAQPGEEGASTVEVQLGSIRDVQIQEIARRPPRRDDVTLDQPEISREERRELERLGIRSGGDLVRTVEEENVDLGRLTGRKLDYGRLAAVLRKARRIGPDAPRVDRLRLDPDRGRDLSVLTMSGRNLAPAPGAPAGYPHAVLGERRLPALAEPGGRRLCIAVPHQTDRPPQVHGTLTVALDPYAALTMQLEPAQEDTHV